MARLAEDRALWIARNVLPHEPALRARLARWNLPEGMDADDVVQEAYCRFAAMESVDDVRNARSYFFMVARNAIVSHVRHSRVVSIRTVDDLERYDVAADEPSPEEQVSDRQQLRQLAEAVAELPEPSRRAFLMRVVDDMPHRAIGETLGMSDNAVQKNIARSIAALLVRIGRGGIPPDRASMVAGGNNSPRSGDEARDEHGN